MGNQESEPSPLNPACLRAGSDMEDNAEKSYLQAKKLLLMIDLLWEIQKPVTPSQFHAEFCKMSRKKSYVKLYEEHAILDLDDIAKDNEWFTSWYTKPETESVQKWIKDELYLKIINDNHLQHLMDGIDQWYSKEVVMKKLTDVMLTTPQQPVGIVHHEDTECLQQKPQHDSSTMKNINTYEKQEEARLIPTSNDLVEIFKKEILKNISVTKSLQDYALRQANENKKLKARVKKLENDIKEMTSTARETRNSMVVKNFLQSSSVNAEKVCKLVEQLEKTRVKASNLQNIVNMKCAKCMEHENGMESIKMSALLLEKELEPHIKKTVKDDEIDKQRIAIDKLKERIKSSYTDIIKSRISGNDQQLQTSSNPNPKKRYIVILEDNRNLNGLFPEHRVKTFMLHDPNLFNSLPLNAYHDQLFIIPYYSNSNQKNRVLSNYDNVISIYQQWKKIRPKGEIHVIGSTGELTALVACLRQY